MRDTSESSKYLIDSKNEKESLINFLSEEIQKDPDNPRNYRVHFIIRQSLCNLLWIEYSLGQTQFSFEWDKYFHHFKESKVDMLKHHIILECSSLGVLFNATSTDFEHIIEVAAYHRVFDDVLKNLSSASQPSQIRSYNSVSEYLIRAIENKDPHQLKSYLDKWYESNKEAYWYDHHKAEDGLYFGYWCLEAAAAVKKFNIPYDLVRDHQYFPVDLVEMDGPV